MSAPRSLDPRILELIGARICHDLISPISAINNGVELVTELGDEMQGEVMTLIGDSARAASRLLQFFRAVFGSARGADGSPMGLKEARQRTIDCLCSPRIEIVWPDFVDAKGRGVSRFGVKLLMNMVMVAVDALPGGGKIALKFEPGENTLFTAVEAAKEGFVLDEGVRRALDGSASIEALTPRTVVAYLCRASAADIGSGLNCAEASGKLVLSATLPWEPIR